MTIYTIYNILNIKNNKRYIGQTTNLELRKKNHLGQIKRGFHINSKITDDLRLYQKEDFIFDILYQIESDDDYKNLLDHLEEYYIWKYNSINNGYNFRGGGRKSFDGYGYTLTGFLNVYTSPYKYTYKYKIGDIQGEIKSKNIRDLKKKVLSTKILGQKLPWKIIDEKIAERVWGT